MTLRSRSDWQTRPVAGPSLQPAATHRSGLSAGRLARHVVVLAVLLLVAWPLLETGGDFIADEGSYGLQVRSLTSTGWDAGYPFALVDPDGDHMPYHAASVDGPVLIPYASHPAWPLALAASTTVLGEAIGLRVWGVASVLALAVVTALIASVLGGRRLAVWAFWAAAASPVLANAWMLWAHAPAAALGAAVALGCLRSHEHRRWVVLAIVCAVVSVFLRSEAVLWAGAVGGALVVAGADRPRRILGLGLAVATGAALVVERWWITSITGGSGAGAVEPRGEGASTIDRLEGLRIALLDGAILSEPGKLVGLMVVVCMAAAVAALARQRHDLAAGLIVLAAAAGVARIMLAPRDPVPGLFAAAPILILLAAWRPADRNQRWLPVALTLYVASIGLTIYPDGGAFQWGGRFLAPVTGAALAMAVVGLARVVEDWPARVGDRLGLAVAALLAVQALGALVVPDRIRSWTAESVSSVAAQQQGVVITEGTQVARLDWRAWPDRCWIAVEEGSGPRGAREVAERLARAGVREAAYAGVDAAVLSEAGLMPRPTSGRIGFVLIPDALRSPNLLPPFRCDG